METTHLDRKTSIRLGRYLAKEAEVPFDKLPYNGVSITHTAGYPVEVTFTVRHRMTLERFNELLELAQKEP